MTPGTRVTLTPEEDSSKAQAPVYAYPVDPFHPAPHVLVRSWRALASSIWTSISFLLQTEVHVYSFAVAVNVLISFFPFLVAMIILCRSVFHWTAGTEIIIRTVTDYFPESFGVNFRGYLTAASYHKFSLLSVLLLLFTANGIFTPLEVALNRIWRVKQNRSFLRNQVIGLGLIFVCGILVLASVSATAVNVPFIRSTFGSSNYSAVLQTVGFHLVAFPVTMLMIFLVYWRLPNAKIPVRRLIPASAAVAVLLETSKYLNILTWPYLSAKLRADVPPFVQSISIVLWSFSATMILLAGAEWSARVKFETSEEAAERTNTPAS
ncbi:MAG TPA: YihY/virulence factor BrkB family protein [Bryobacteraceae bacterium]|nr:YihY/virulence factor BrkB family protein [Bryobacteraceae bacterium]